MDGSQYNFSYSESSVYGHVVSLVRTYVSGSSGVHLDLGCGFGSIAEEVRALGLTYVGIDLASPGLQSLSDRGFETHQLDLLSSGPKGLGEAFDAVVGDRSLSSISMIDTLEHITNDDVVLQALQRLSVQHGSVPLVVSVPNAAHRDLGIKLLCGRWDYTETGLLDATHVIHHTEKLLRELTGAAGWHEVAQQDLILENSDQHFPADFSALSPATPLNAYLRKVRDMAGPHADTNQFVRAYLPGPAISRPSEAEAEPALFLSVLIRTQGTRLDTLRESLLCLLGQTSQDFEVIVLPHKVDYPTQVAVERVVDDLPYDLRRRARVLPVHDGGRSRPLNVGVSAARGRYVAILDDDDTVLGHWVETFLALARKTPGRALRTVAVQQDIAGATADGISSYRVTNATRKIYPSEFDLIAHFTENFSPPMTWALPRSAFVDFGLQFDEALNVLEDWAAIMQVVLLCGVATSAEITAVYRWWVNAETSHTLHGRDEWKVTEDSIVRMLDSQPHVFPPGTIAAFRRLTALAEGGRVARESQTSPAEIGAYSTEAAELRAALRNAELCVEELRASASWRITRPLRAVTGLRVRRRATGD